MFGPELESQLRPHGLTLRHYPQSFTGSTLGGWIATRSGGHYATNHTHIDEFVESVRMLTPSGWWESRRLPGGGAGPDPNRMAIGSEGILGIITEAWMRIQVRPKYRATAGVTFPTWEGSCEAARHIVQAKLWPSNLRVLDPELSRDAAGMDGRQALLIIGFESAELPQDWNIRAAVDMARQSGGQVDDDEILIDHGSGTPTGRSGAVGAWRNAFVKLQRGADGGAWTGDGDVGDGGDVGPLARAGRTRAGGGRSRVDGGVRWRVGQLPIHSRISRRSSAPYYTYAGAYRSGDYAGQQAAIKQAASDAIIESGGTITHHHAVGRLHRPWYDRERPEVFAEALRAAKRSLDPNGILNPGVLIDP